MGRCGVSRLGVVLLVALFAQAAQAQRDELVKFLLHFEDPTGSSTHKSQPLFVPEGKRLVIDEVSVHVELNGTTAPPPVKALVSLFVQHPDNEGAGIRYPVGSVDWLDRSQPPFLSSTMGMLREPVSIFVDGPRGGSRFLRVYIETNESLQFATQADRVLAQATIVGRLVRQPRNAP